MDRLPTKYELDKQKKQQIKQTIVCTCLAIIIVAVSLIIIG